ncbi:MAG: phosphate acetyltransferase [Rhizobiaceae bacterium]
MKALDDIIARARSNPRHVVLAEGEDPRIVEGALRAIREGVARVTLVGDTESVARLVQAEGGDLAVLGIEDPAHSPRTEVYIREYYALRRHKGVDEAAAGQAMCDPLRFAAMMVRQGDAEGAVGGAVATTAETVRAALQIIGKADDSRLVSSFFLMMLCEPYHERRGAFVFADCGLVVEPDASELGAIAITSARSFAALTGAEPRVAMLSFSTGGSAAHERVTKVTEASRLVRQADPTLTIDGELQFDAAFVAAVSASKSPTSPLHGEANVLVFPNLDAGNIGYKIAQRIGGAKAIGPILQGLAKPANDLSRGCSADDVFHLIAVTSLQAAATARVDS